MTSKRLQQVVLIILAIPLLLFAKRLSYTAIFDGNICLEGSTKDANTVCLVATDPTGARTWTIPDLSDTFVGLAATQTLTNKTISGASNTLTLLSHATDCTSITTGVVNQMCLELDAETLYTCQPTAGGCDTAGEWILTGGGGGTTPDYILVDEVHGTFGTTGSINTGFIEPGWAISGLTILGGGTLRPGDGMLVFNDIDTDVLWITLGVLPTGYDYTNLTLSMSLQNRITTTNNAEFEVQLACIVDGTQPGATFAAFSTYSTAQTYTMNIGDSTIYDSWFDTLTGLDATTNSSGCAAGTFAVMEINRKSSDAHTGDVALWHVRLSAPAI